MTAPEAARALNASLGLPEARRADAATLAGDVFKAAKPRQRSRKKTGTVLDLGALAGDVERLAAALRAHRAAHAARKQADDQLSAAKRELLPLARRAFIRAWIAGDKRPPAPLTLVAGPERATYCVEDRSATDAVELSDKFVAALRDVLGEERAAALESEAHVTYEFDSETLAEPGVRAAVAAAIQAAPLSAEQKQRLVCCRRRLGTPALQSLAPLCTDEPRLTALLEALGGSLRTYLKG